MGIGHVASSAPGGSYLSGAAAMMGRGGVTSRTSSRKAAGSGERGKGPSVAMAAGPGCQRSYRRRREDGGGSVRGASGRRPAAVRPPSARRQAPARGVSVFRAPGSGGRPRGGET